MQENVFVPQEIIRKKRDGAPLTPFEINFMVKGVVKGTVSEAQVAALAMAIFFRGLNQDETVQLTHAMVKSGKVLDWSDLNLNGPLVDKHSTGGVGDKVSLILVPMLAACGAYVPKISGHALDFTGGTLDKLDSIPGYNTHPTLQQLRKVIVEVGCANVGQTADLTPADKVFYAVRDITGTVDSIPLITSSILCKKLAAGVNALVLDVKFGSGALMQSISGATLLAENLVNIAKSSGLPTSALLTDMNQVLGTTVGNALEIEESIEFLTGQQQETRLREVIFALGAEVLVLANLANHLTEAKEFLSKNLENGNAAEKFSRMVAALGGPNNFVSHYRSHLPRAPLRIPLFPQKIGFIESIDTRALGLVLQRLGGGRLLIDDKIDYAVGLSHVAMVGQRVEPSTPLLMIHARSESSIELVSHLLLDAFHISENAPSVLPVVHKKIS